MDWPEPKWLQDAPAAERERLRVKFFIGLAALYNSPSASTLELSAALDFHKTSISAIKSRGVMSAKLALKIERLLGRELFSSDTLYPEATQNRNK